MEHISARVRTRQEAETEMLAKTPELRPVDASVQPLIEAAKDGRFAWSLCGIALYCTGYSLNGSSPHRLGLLYANQAGDTWALGYFKKQTANSPQDRSFLHIVAPSGPSIVKTVSKFVQKFRQELGISGDHIYIRHVPLALAEEFKASELGYQEVAEHPQYWWHPEAPIEDETYSHGTIRLDDVLALEGEAITRTRKDGVLVNSTASTTEIKSLSPDYFADELVPDKTGALRPRVISANHRTKSRQWWNRSARWLQLNRLVLELRPIDYQDPEQARSIRELIHDHFESLRKRKIDIGSNVEDYLGLIEVPQLKSVNQAPFRSSLACLKDASGKSVPIAYFAGEIISRDLRTLALYATVVSRNEMIFKGYIDPQTGIKSLPRYAMLKFLEALKREGIEVVKLGGSETADLDQAKMYLGAREEKTTWLVV